MENILESAGADESQTQNVKLKTYPESHSTKTLLGEQ